MISYKDIISSLPSDGSFLRSELESNSRKYTGYTLFSRQFYFIFKSERHKHIKCTSSVDVVMAKVTISDSYEENSSYSSFSIESDDVAQDSSDVMKHMCKMWNDMVSEQQSYWRRRALLLNKEPKLGEFKELPDFLSDSGAFLTNRFLPLLTNDWNRFVKIMRSSLKQHRCRESDRTYNFLGEVVTVGTQSYRCISVSDILLETIFGHNYSCNKILDLIVYKSTNLIHMNFASARRLQDVFTMNKNCGVNFIVEGNRYVCCGKVQLVWKGKLILGYIMDEDDTHYHVHIMMNMIIKVKNPQFREERKPYGALRCIFLNLNVFRITFMILTQLKNFGQ